MDGQRCLLEPEQCVTFDNGVLRRHVRILNLRWLG
jgi:hypothetical protein